MSGADLPDQMQAVEITRPGAPEVLKLTSRPVPRPGSDEVLIRVHAAGVNRPDVLQRMGAYPPPPGASDIPGLEVAGEICALGAETSEHTVGDKVCALLTGGGYAGYVLAHQGSVLPVPTGLSMVEAAALPETFFTVWSNVFDRAGLQAGEVFLVHGGSSGIGTSAIQMARAMGARVFATAGSDKKCRACEALGAERAINYREEDFVAVLKEATNKRGADVILDMVGGDYIGRNINTAAKDGRIVNIAYLNGSKAEVNFMAVMLKRLTLTGSTLRIRSPEVKAMIAEQLQAHIWPHIKANRICPVIDTVLPLSEVSGAHARMESSAHIGKIILDTMATA